MEPVVHHDPSGYDHMWSDRLGGFYKEDFYLAPERRPQSLAATAIEGHN